MNQAILTRYNSILFLLIYEDHKLVECHPVSETKSLQVGNIYVGRVDKTVKNIQAAFVRLEQEQTGYLSLTETPLSVLNRTLPKGPSSLAENDTVLVQVTQEAQKLKQARVSGNISLHGNYIAVDISGKEFGISKKIKDATLIEALYGLKQRLNLKYPEYAAFSYVFRTACLDADAAEIEKEYAELGRELLTILETAKYRLKTGCIHAARPEYIEILEQYGLERLDEIKTDEPEYYQELKKLSGHAILYEDTEYPLYKLLCLETELERLQDRRVWLKSGGFLIIEPTEAMVVIDVNSGKSIGKKDHEQHVFKVNSEAASEIARQMRLRNLSGMILVDFINQKDPVLRKRLIALLEQEFKKDKVPTAFIDVTKLQLYEFTRKKIRKPLHEALKGFHNPKNDTKF